jgi:hypothetical protein
MAGDGPGFTAGNPNPAPIPSTTAPAQSFFSIIKATGAFQGDIGAGTAKGPQRAAETSSSGIRRATGVCDQDSHWL